MTSLRAHLSSQLRFALTLAGCLILASWTTSCSSPAQAPTLECTKSTDCQAGEGCIANKCVALPCAGKCKDDQVCLNDTCRSAQNLDCSTDPDRCPSAFTCSNGRCKRSCTYDQDCPEPATCNVDLFVCAECSLDRDCTADPTRPYCDKDVGTCVGCIENGQCKENGLAAGKYCDQTTQTCAPGCNSLADCPIGTKSCLGGSDMVAGKCIECSANIDCTTPGKGFCDTTTNACVECLSNAQCGTNQCDMVSHRCVECLDDLACNQRGVVCNPQTFKCVEGCTNGSGSGQCPPDTACDTTRGPFGTCVRCVANTDCPRGQVCVGGQTPACVPGCDNDARCAPTEAEPTATDTICDPTKGSKGTCVQCRADANCDPGLVCDPTSGTCRCKKPGEACSSTDECGHEVVQNGQTVVTCAKPATNNPYFCIAQVKCSATGERSVPSVCSSANGGGGLPDRDPPDTTGCPSGFAVERAKDASGNYIQVCVPDKSPYTCH